MLRLLCTFWFLLNIKMYFTKCIFLSEIVEPITIQNRFLRISFDSIFVCDNIFRKTKYLKVCTKRLQHKLDIGFFLLSSIKSNTIYV